MELQLKRLMSFPIQVIEGKSSILKAGKLSLQPKLRLFKSNVLTSLLYDAELWKMTETIGKKLEVFHMDMFFVSLQLPLSE